MSALKKVKMAAFCSSQISHLFYSSAFLGVKIGLNALMNLYIAALEINVWTTSMHPQITKASHHSQIAQASLN